MSNRISDEELMERLKKLGTFLWLDPEADEKDYRFLLNLNTPNLEYNGYNDFTLNKDGSYTVGSRNIVIDINVLDDNQFEIGVCHSIYNVSGLENLQKIISIGYGSPFSIKLEKRGVGWVSYSIKIPMLTVYSIYQLEKHIETLRYLLVQVMNTVKLDID
ncbi:hypothetical protein [Enterococcus sp. AZ134]|uniref:hypothetical protein n=1 Tax=Enterococcus sp. AZ134 TaxID=2774901 RepID=UPI003F295BAC